MICAVIFDMDGVLIDTEKHYNAAWCQAATEAGFPFTREHALLLRSCEAKEGEKTTISLLEEGKISYVISTSKTGRQPGRDSVRLRRKAVELGIPCLTSLDTAAVLALTLESKYNEDNVELVDIAHIAHGAAARKELSQMEKPEEIQIPGYVLQEHEND